VFLSLFSFAVLGFELMAYTFSHLPAPPAAPFCDGLKIGFGKLFAWVGFEL
jgi:hypothetical protein